MRFTLLFLITIFFASGAAYANCALTTLGACSSAGRWDYDAPNNTYRFCNGTNWISMNGASTAGPCSTTGTLDYDTGLLNYKFCDGSNWRPVAGQVTSDSCTASRAIDYDTASNSLRWCNGTNWVRMTGLQSAAIGTQCADGSIYAGLSPDGNVEMYTTPADAGMFTWNDGSTNYVDTAMQNCVSTSPGAQASCQTGEANTALLVALGTSPTPAPYVAARHCDNLVAHGQTDWYLPSSDELNVLRTNRVAIGAFDLSGAFYAGWYLSSSESSSSAPRQQRFSDGLQFAANKEVAMKIRCVRR